jgi:hypothetical protein
MTERAEHTAFTPGPWKFESDETSSGQIFTVYDERGVRISDAYIDENPARLIAAAPDLLAALIAADQTLTGEDACNIAPILGSDNPHEHAAGLVRTALSRATGANHDS